MHTPRLITEARIEAHLVKQNALLERLCEAVERLIPPVTEDTPTDFSVEEVPDFEHDEEDQSAGLAEFEREQQETYEQEILSMSEEEYHEFRIRSGSDPRAAIRARQKAIHQKGGKGKGKGKK